LNHDSETDLMRALRAGDAGAFAAVYGREKSVLYGFLVRLSADVNVAADLFQNVWLKLARHCRRLRPDTNVRAWLFTVARREYVSYRRAQALDLSRVLAFGREAQAVASADLGLSELARALGHLSDADRMLLLMTSVDGLNAAEAASALGINEAALRQRLARARRRLQVALEEGAALHACATPAKGER
jgi:RNA polymerase sigma-70 factor (ECF subfamily)